TAAELVEPVGLCSRGGTRDEPRSHRRAAGLVAARVAGGSRPGRSAAAHHRSLGGAERTQGATPAGLLGRGSRLGRRIRCRRTGAHKGEVQILFGDTDDTFDSVCRGQLHNDDSQGVIPLEPPATGVPPLTFLTLPNDPNVLQRIFVFRNGESLQMGYGQVPVAACSDGQNLVAIMGRGGTIPCKAGVASPVAACRGPLEDHPARSNWISADGLRCSQKVGECIPAPNGISTPCELATGAGCNPGLGETCRPTAAGLCVDPSSSQNDGTPVSQVYTTANGMHSAIQDPDPRANDESVATMRTNKFINPTARKVNRFTGRPAGSDYGPGTDTLLVWGRPGFSGQQGRQAQIYLFAH